MTHIYEKWFVGLVVWSATFMLMGLLTVHAQQATPKCGPYDIVVATITGEKYSELPFAEGTMGGGPAGDNPVQWFANPKTRTWTMLMVPTPGIACLMFGGENFGPPTLITTPPPGSDS